MSLPSHPPVTFERHGADFARMTPERSYPHLIKSVNKPVCFTADRVIAIDSRKGREEPL